MTTKLIGQNEAIALLNAVATRRSNVLLVGGPGMGKTTFARWYLSKFASRILEITGEREIVVATLYRHKAVLIDEAHKLLHPESLYKILEPGYAKPVFALATTDQGMLPKPLVTRLVKVVLKPYSKYEIAQIIRVHHPSILEDVSEEIASFAWGNPRRAIMLGQILIDAVTSGVKATTLDELYKRLGYTFGLDAQEHELLLALEAKPRSITTLSGILGVGRATINEIEIGLIKAGLVQITSKGRALTDTGYALVQRIKNT